MDITDADFLPCRWLNSDGTDTSLTLTERKRNGNTFYIKRMPHLRLSAMFERKLKKLYRTLQINVLKDFKLLPESAPNRVRLL